jgi:hypothetical protein
MLDDTSDGADYLSALKQSGSPQAAGAGPARAPAGPRSAETRTADVAPSSRPGATSAEKRKSPRYRCKGSARLQEVGSGVTTWATFTDISMRGCYVEAAAPYRVGAALDIRLQARGFQIEAGGEVSVTYPNLGMGISFTRIAEEDRKRLRELLRSISPASAIVGAPGVPPVPSVPEDPRSETLSPAINSRAALQAIKNFFEDRYVMGREEFLRILRKSQ